MKRLIAILAAAHVVASVFAADGVRVASWNLKWFPAGHPVKDIAARTANDVKYESYRINTTARFIRRQNADVVMLEEVRSRSVCDILANTCDEVITNAAAKGWKVVACSEFQAPPDAAVPAHQNAIISHIPAIDAGWCEWKEEDGLRPPRGYTFAVFDIGGKLTALVCVHLKSNFIPADAPDPEGAPAVNRKLREISARQLVAFAKELKAKKYGDRKVENVIIGGDFNTSVFDDKYKDETTIKTLLEAGFKDCHEGVQERNTMPESKWYPATCFDYMFFLGKAEVFAPVVAPPAKFGKHHNNLSDHQMISVMVR